MSLLKQAQKILDLADVKIGGSRPWDIEIINPQVVARCMSNPALTMGEAYMDYWWDTPALDEFICRIESEQLENKVRSLPRLILQVLWARLLNHQTVKRSRNVAHTHYNMGNDLYEAMLGPSMTYTCGYWTDAKNLDEAQSAKLKLICEKLEPEPGERLLDIGCGFGSMARFAEEHYGCEVTAISISEEQIKYAKSQSGGRNIDYHVCDYREPERYNASHQPFDKIVSIGMFEHVGAKNFNTYFKLAQSQLKDHGLFLLHTIGCDVAQKHTNPWINRYIFPGGAIPDSQQISLSTQRYFSLQDWQNFGPDYDQTLMAWMDNFHRAAPELGHNVKDPFYRMMDFYLKGSAGAFRARAMHLWQIVFSKHYALDRPVYIAAR